MAEERFFRIMRENNKYPDWFCGIVRSSAMFDVKGIDAFAYVRQQRTQNRVKVPIQLKTSRVGIQLFFKQWPEYWQQRVIALNVSPLRSEEEICRALFSELLHVYKGAYDYRELLRHIVNGPHKKKEILLAREIRCQRRKFQNNNLNS